MKRLPLPHSGERLGPVMPSGKRGGGPKAAPQGQHSLRFINARLYAGRGY